MLGHTAGKVAVVLAALAALACGKKEGAEEPSATSGPAAGEGKVSEEVKRLLGAAPDDIDVVAWLDAPAPLWDLALDPGLLPMKEEIKEELDGDLRAFLEKRTGLDVSGVKAVVLFGRAKDGGSLSILAAGVKGELSGGKVWIDKGDDVAAQVKDGVLGIGSDQATAEALGRLGGDLPPLAGWLRDEQKGALLAAAFAVDAFEPPDDLDVERASAGFGAGGVRLVATGDEKGLERLEKKIAELKDTALTALEKQREMMTSAEASSAGGAELVAGAGAIVQDHMLRAGLESFAPQREGNRLAADVRIQMGDPTVIVAVVGMLSAIAIPAFMKYIKKSKTAEARMFVHRLADGARMAKMESGSYPPSAGPTPPLGTCCRQGEKCAPDPSLWQGATWSALQFSVDDPHYYSYEFSSEGHSFTASAYGDLDCDGVYSTFQMIGSESGGMPPMARIKELE